MITSTSPISNMAWARCAGQAKPSEPVVQNYETIYQRLDREPSLNRQLDMQDAYNRVNLVI